ncbi:MAG: glutaredoxin family protein [Ardenticatenaceae bacterium]
MTKELVLYGRAFACYDQVRAIAYLDGRRVPYRFVDISRDEDAVQRLLSWVGHLSVPTLFVACPGDDSPIAEPAALDPRRHIRGQNRGSLITEPTDEQLKTFLQQHGLL